MFKLQFPYNREHAMMSSKGETRANENYDFIKFCLKPSAFPEVIQLLFMSIADTLYHSLMILVSTKKKNSFPLLKMKTNKTVLSFMFSITFVPAGISVKS